VDSLDDQHLPFELDLSGRLAKEEPFTSRDLTRLQRASKGPDQSTRRGRDHVVERRGVRFILARLRAVVRGDRPVRPEPDRLGFGRKPSLAQWPLHSLDEDPGKISDFGHDGLQELKQSIAGPACNPNFRLRSGEDRTSVADDHDAGGANPPTDRTAELVCVDPDARRSGPSEGETPGRRRGSRGTKAIAYP